MKKRENKFGNAKIYITVSLAFIILAAQVAAVNIGDVSSGYYVPPFQEATYIIGVYNSTHYYAKNHTGYSPGGSGYEFLSDNASEVINNAFSAGDGIFFFKGGTYNLDTRLDPDDGDSISGEYGTAQFVSSNYNTWQIMLQNHKNIKIENIWFQAYNQSEDNIYAKGTKNVTIQNCIFDGGIGINAYTGAMDTTQDLTVDHNIFRKGTTGIELNSASGAKISNIAVTNNKAENLSNYFCYIVNATRVTVSHNQVNQTDRRAIAIIDCDVVSIIGNTLTNCNLNEIYKSAIDVRYPSSLVSVTGNTMLWNTNPSQNTNGILIENGLSTRNQTNIAVSGNTIEGNGFSNMNSGIYLHGTTASRETRIASISGNTIRNMTRGITVTYAYGVAVDGNVIDTMSLNGIHVASSANCSVSDNIIINSGTGLKETGSSDWNRFSDNHLISCTTEYSLAGANTIAQLDYDSGTSYPSNPEEGMQFYLTTNHTLWIYNSTHWVNVGEGTTGPQGPQGELEGEQPYDYLIFENATSKYLQDGSSGQILTNNNDANKLVQWCVDNYTSWHLHIKSGVYECYSQVDFGTETYFTITGSGWTTELELNGNLGTGVDFWEFDYTALSHGRFIIRDLYFDMDGDSYTSRDCISIVGGERWTLDTIKVLRPYRDGLNIDETGGTGYTRYNTINNFQVYYAGRYGVYCDGRDNFFYNLQIEYSYDSCVVFASAGAGNYVSGLHSTGAHNTDQTQYTSQAGGGNSRYSGLEVIGSGNSFEGLYLDRCNKTGAYVTGSNNGFVGRRVYECNYQASSSGYADIWIDGDFNRVVAMELNGQASNPTNYGVHLDTGSNNCTVVANIGRDHAIAHFQDDGTNNQVDLNG